MPNRAMIEAEGLVKRYGETVALAGVDLAVPAGAILGVLGLANRPVSYLTTGQAVPDDIEPADRKRLARLILGLEAIG